MSDRTHRPAERQERIAPSPNGEPDFPYGENASEDPPQEQAEPTPQPSATEAPDPFDPEALRLTGDLSASAGVQKALLSVPARKPNKSEWVRTHPDPAYRLQTAVVELREERGSKTYLLAPALRPQLVTEPTFRLKLFLTAITRQNNLFLWEVNLPRADGRDDEWSRTSIEAANMATTSWIRVAANMSLGAYDVFKATGQLSEPEWPAVPFRELLRLAFKDRFIDTVNHPILRQLRGEV